MYKMFVTDLDGTFLDDYKEIPSENIKAVKRLKEEFGVIPVIATARPLEVAKYIADKGEGIFDYIIATNGAILKDIQEDELIINESLQEEQIAQIIDLCKRHELEYEFMTTKCEVADVKYSYRRVVDPMYDNMGVPFNYQTDLEEYIANIDEPIPLFAVNGTEEQLAECYSELSSIEGLQISAQCIRTTPEKDSEGKLKTLAYYDIMKKGVTKASAIERLANLLGIKKEEIIVAGDGGNDIEMFQIAGLGIAMSNATPKLKDIADVITPVDNNEGGVGRAINALCKQLENRKQQEIEIETQKSLRTTSMLGEGPDL